MNAAHSNRKKPTVPVPAASPQPTTSTAHPVTPAATENTVSMIFGAVVVGIILLLGISFWRDWRRNATAENAQEQNQVADAPLLEVEELPNPAEVQVETDANGEAIPVNLPAKYTVKNGDSTWKIAMAFYGSGFNYVDIEAANNLTPDSQLAMGQELTIPKVPVRKTAGGRPAGQYTMQPGTPAPDSEVGPSKGDTTEETSVLEAPAEITPMPQQ